MASAQEKRKISRTEQGVPGVPYLASFARYGVLDMRLLRLDHLESSNRFKVSPVESRNRAPVFQSRRCHDQVVEADHLAR